jgi:hypothetical protein
MRSVLHNHKYLTPRHVIHMVKQAQHVCSRSHRLRSEGTRVDLALPNRFPLDQQSWCSTESYLHCVCEWAEVQVITTKFALALNRPDINNPYAFVEAYVRQYPELISPDM